MASDSLDRPIFFFGFMVNLVKTNKIITHKYKITFLVYNVTAVELGIKYCKCNTRAISETSYIMYLIYLIKIIYPNHLQLIQVSYLNSDAQTFPHKFHITQPPSSHLYTLIPIYTTLPSSPSAQNGKKPSARKQSSAPRRA